MRANKQTSTIPRTTYRKAAETPRYALAYLSLLHVEGRFVVADQAFVNTRLMKTESVPLGLSPLEKFGYRPGGMWYAPGVMCVNIPSSAPCATRPLSLMRVANLSGWLPVLKYAPSRKTLDTPLPPAD